MLRSRARLLDRLAGADATPKATTRSVMRTSEELRHGLTQACRRRETVDGVSVRRIWDFAQSVSTCKTTPRDCVRICVCDCLRLQRLFSEASAGVKHLKDIKEHHQSWPQSSNELLLHSVLP
jgi:hypothetical protein